MRVLPSFDPSNTKNNQINVGSGDPGCKLLMYNQSIVTVKLDFQDGNTAILHAGEANYWVLENVTPYIIWTQYSILNATGATSSQITCTLYNPDEQITGTYPMSLVYQTNIGNTLGVNTNSVATTAQQLQNDGSTNATTIIESTPTGAAASTWLAKNDGTLTVQEYVSSVLTTLLQILPGNSTALKLAALGRIVEIIGGLTVDQNLNVTGNTNVAALTATGLASLQGGVTVVGSTSVGSVSASGSVTTGGNITVGTNLSVVGTSSLDNGAFTTEGNGTIDVPKIKFTGGTTTPGITTTAAGDLSLNVPSTTSVGTLNSNGLLLTGGRFGQVNQGDIIDGNGTTTFVKGAGKVTIQYTGGSSVADFNSGGLDLRTYGKGASANTVNFTTGSITRISKFSGTLGTSAGGNSVAHGLGTTPDICIITVNSSSSTTTYSCTWDATNCHAFGFAALAFNGIALKF